MKPLFRRTRRQLNAAGASLLLCCAATTPLQAADLQSLAFISDTQYPWTDKSDSGMPESASERNARSRQFIERQAESVDEFRRSNGGLDEVPLFLNGDLTAFAHGEELSYMKGRPFAIYARNFYVNLGNHDYQNNVNDCANNGCARDAFLAMAGWAQRYKAGNLDYHSYNARSDSQVSHTGSLAYSKVFGGLLAIQLQNEPSYTTGLVSNGGDFVARITPSLGFLRRELAWARAAGKDVILNMHKRPYVNWTSPQDASFVKLMKDNEDIILGIFAGHEHRSAGRMPSLGSIPVYLSGASYRSTWLTGEYAASSRTLRVHLVQGNDWKNRTLVGTSTATAARDTTVMPNYAEYTAEGWGQWGPVVLCPKGQGLVGLRIKAEAYQDKGDDTAMNGVRFRCGAPGIVGPELQSAEGPWGTWGEEMRCENGSIRAFRMRIEDYQGGDDDTGMGNLRVYCMPGLKILDGKHAAQWGNWSAFYTCPEGKRPIGFTSKVEANLGDSNSSDDTALNRVQLVCGNTVR